MHRLLPAATLLALAPPALAQSPSFDCAKAGTTTEYAICGNPELAELDAALARAYSAARATGGDAVRDSQRAWIETRDACSGDHSCLAHQMQSRIDQLASAAAAPQAATDRSGAYCPDDGTGFGFVDKGDYALVSIDLFFANGHFCGTGEMLAARPEGDGYVIDDAGCTIHVTPGPTGFHVRSDTLAECQRNYCGARGYITEFDVPYASRSSKVRDPESWSWMEQGC